MGDKLRWETTERMSVGVGHHRQTEELRRIFPQITQVFDTESIKPPPKYPPSFRCLGWSSQRRQTNLFGLRGPAVLNVPGLRSGKGEGLSYHDQLFADPQVYQASSIMSSDFWSHMTSYHILSYFLLINYNKKKIGMHQCTWLNSSEIIRDVTVSSVLWYWGDSNIVRNRLMSTTTLRLQTIGGPLGQKFFSATVKQSGGKWEIQLPSAHTYPSSFALWSLRLSSHCRC